MKAPTPMKYHSPGWELDTGGMNYWVWAPNEKRSHWSACWQGTSGANGNFVQGDSLEVVLAIFGPAVQRLFREVAA